jgi:hypothetical protein
LFKSAELLSAAELVWLGAAELLGATELLRSAKLIATTVLLGLGVSTERIELLLAAHHVLLTHAVLTHIILTHLLSHHWYKRFILLLWSLASKLTITTKCLILSKLIGWLLRTHLNIIQS